MNDPNRPKDIIDHIEALAAKHGHFEPVDENYYQAFVELNQPQIEKLAVALMLDQFHLARVDVSSGAVSGETLG